MQGGYPGYPSYPQPAGYGYPQSQPPPAGFAMPASGYSMPASGYAPPPNYPGNVEAGGGGDFGGDGFSDKAIRMGFIRKVYSILSVMLIVWSSIVLFFNLKDGTKMWIAQNRGIVWVSLGVSIVSLLVLACCGSVRRKFPMNFICLGLFTIAQSLSFGFITAFYKTNIVVLALFITAAICIAITIFSFQTKIDFTVFNGIALVAGVVFFIFGIICAFVTIQPLQIVYAAIGALLFGFYLIIDTQMIVGGSHKNQISPEEYIFGAITLFTDIINIFLFILQLLNASSND